MTDRSAVTLDVPKWAVEVVHQMLDNEFKYLGEPDDTVDGEFTFREVSYGSLPFLDRLMELEIPFDAWADPGIDYGDSEDHWRPDTGRWDFSSEQAMVLLRHLIENKLTILEYAGKVEAIRQHYPHPLANYEGAEYVRSYQPPQPPEIPDDNGFPPLHYA